MGDGGYCYPFRGENFVRLFNVLLMKVYSKRTEFKPFESKLFCLSVQRGKLEVTKVTKGSHKKCSRVDNGGTSTC